jgi:hypothetical protein
MATAGGTQVANTQVRPDVDILALTAFLDSLQSHSVDLVLNPQADQSLYHYTDLGGLLGILQCHDLWLTIIRYTAGALILKTGYTGVVSQYLTNNWRANDP